MSTSCDSPTLFSGAATTDQVVVDREYLALLEEIADRAAVNARMVGLRVHPKTFAGRDFVGRFHSMEDCLLRLLRFL
jgi:hypothetical protein